VILEDADEPTDHYGRALESYKSRGVPNAEILAAFFAGMCESLEVLIEAAEHSWKSE
jgi:hypothetical protein